MEQVTEQNIYRVHLSGGKIEIVSLSDAYEEATANIKWAFKNASEMFTPVRIGDKQIPQAKQSKTYLYSADLDCLIRNANRLGIAINK